MSPEIVTYKAPRGLAVFPLGINSMSEGHVSSDVLGKQRPESPNIRPSQDLDDSGSYHHRLQFPPSSFESLLLFKPLPWCGY